MFYLVVPSHCPLAGLGRYFPLTRTVCRQCPTRSTDLHRSSGSGRSLDSDNHVFADALARLHKQLRDYATSEIAKSAERRVPAPVESPARSAARGDSANSEQPGQQQQQSGSITVPEAVDGEMPTRPSTVLVLRPSSSGREGPSQGPGAVSAGSLVDGAPQTPPAPTSWAEQDPARAAVAAAVARVLRDARAGAPQQPTESDGVAVETADGMLARMLRDARAGAAQQPTESDGFAVETADGMLVGRPPIGPPGLLDVGNSYCPSLISHSPPHDASQRTCTDSEADKVVSSGWTGTGVMTKRPQRTEG